MRYLCLKGVTAMSDNNLQDMIAAMDGHQVTDDTGQVQEEDTSVENTATQESTTVEEEQTPEKPKETEAEESDSVEDDEGKKYVPEKRFKEVYAQRRDAERRAKELEEQLAKASSQEPRTPVKVDRAEMLENELLFTKYPQFDPNNSDYDQDLDDYAGDVYRASMVGGRNITKLEAARKALDKMKKLSSKEASIREEARTIKKSMVESVTSKGGQRVESQSDPDNMSLDDMESYMKSHGAW